MLVHGDSITSNELIAFSNRYGAILQKYSVNHEDLDYYKYQVEAVSER
jgi:hypothetical protein